MFIILTGKTASGKDTIKSALLKKYPKLNKVLTTTSRSPRQNEVDNVDYHFVSRDEFEKKISLGDFAEYVDYGGNLYGTEKKELEQVLKSDMLWKIDPSRAGKIKSVFKKAIVIYITCDDEVVLQRLKNRGLTQEEIQSRMRDDAKIWKAYKDNYDFVIENVSGKLNETMKQVNQIICADTSKVEV